MTVAFIYIIYYIFKKQRSLKDFFFFFWIGGRLPVTWYPQSFADEVAMNNMRMRPDPSTGYPGRTYRFYTGDVVYSFGDGLSYNDYGHHLVEAPKLISIPLEEGHACYSKRCKSIEAIGSRCENVAFDMHLRVHNPGRMAGSHTVFLFSTPPSVHNSPQKHLIGFEKIYLGPKGVGNVMFKVDVCKDLSLVDELGNRKVALGSHILHVGTLKHSLMVRV